MASTAKNRFGNVGSGSNLPNGEQSRPLHGSNFVSGLGNGSTGWIWGGTAVGSGRRINGYVESGRNQGSDESYPECNMFVFANCGKDDIPGFTGNVETIAGAGSFLGSENWGSHHVNQWKPVDNTSPTLSSSHQSSSSMRRQSSTQLLPHTYGEPNSSNSSYFPQGGNLTQGIASKPSRKVFQDSNTANFASNPFDKAQTSRSSRHGSEDDNPYSSVFHSDNAPTRIQLERQSLHQNFSGYNSSAASQIGSLPPSRNGVDPSRGDDTFNTQSSQLGPSTSNASQRQNLLTHTSSHTPRTGSYGPKSGGQPSPPQLSGLSGDFNNLNVVSRDGQSTYFPLQKKKTHSGNTPFPQDFSHQIASNGTSNTWEDNGYAAGLNGFNQDAILPSGLPPHQSVYHSPPFATPYSHSPSNGDPRRGQQSSFYPSTVTPPSGIPHRISKSSLLNGSSSGSTVLLERTLHGLQQEQQDYPSQPNQIQFRQQPFHQSFDLHPQSPMRMNPLAYYPAVSNLIAAPAIPRGPAREHDIGQPVRSTLLEDFRVSSKTNKRYELKDIYDHVVEFSGDQHGSRFIQQKLETANSDEKEQVFREIHPNSLQLMTDVFGNYVIQKFFEHGNQGQKKILAGQMKNHILTLSMQMYGCRVVQKALEHILTDQQALLVKELENHVLKCVKDQNGNHVIQKAIERVPAEHIQFIINAFTGQVFTLATHPYGCRVIQRMLEHCEEPTRSALLKELHACANTLIIDQYGNYVTQHVIEHGREEDRTKIILLVTGNLVSFSKHKFASNVVEKSIQFGTPGQRAKIISTLTVLNQHGESPLQGIIRDQYGNYVIQKLLTQLRGSESENFIEMIKPQLSQLKRFSYGKQIAAIEKMVYNNATLPPQAQKKPGLPQPLDTSVATSTRLITSDTHSPHSVSIPSTDASTCSRKSSTSHTQEVNSPNSTR